MKVFRHSVGRHDDLLIVSRQYRHDLLICPNDYQTAVFIVRLYLHIQRIIQNGVEKIMVVMRKVLIFHVYLQNLSSMVLAVDSSSISLKASTTFFQFKSGFLSTRLRVSRSASRVFLL